jgi:hypothetical protein
MTTENATITMTVQQMLDAATYLADKNHDYPSPPEEYDRWHVLPGSDPTSQAYVLSASAGNQWQVGKVISFREVGRWDYRLAVQFGDEIDYGFGHEHDDFSHSPDGALFDNGSHLPYVGDARMIRISQAILAGTATWPDAHDGMPDEEDAEFTFYASFGPPMTVAQAIAAQEYTVEDETAEYAASWTERRWWVLPESDVSAVAFVVVQGKSGHQFQLGTVLACAEFQIVVRLADGTIDGTFGSRESVAESKDGRYVLMCDDNNIPYIGDSRMASWAEALNQGVVELPEPTAEEVGGPLPTEIAFYRTLALAAR